MYPETQGRIKYGRLCREYAIQLSTSRATSTVADFGPVRDTGRGLHDTATQIFEKLCEKKRAGGLVVESLHYIRSLIPIPVCLYSQLQA